MPPLVHYVGGPLDCQSGEFARLPGTTERVWAQRRCTSYLLALLEFDDGRAAWAYVDEKLPLVEARCILQQRLQPRAPVARAVTDGGCAVPS